MDTRLDFNKYQEFTRTTAKYPHTKAFTYLMAGLASEVGEVLGKFKKEIRDEVDNTDVIIDELGDVLWYVSRLADEYGIPLSEVAEANQWKLSDRLERDVISGDGDKR
jgi:NTP pyrophosphatase (non-canonical NTP hydrolase)